MCRITGMGTVLSMRAGDCRATIQVFRHSGTNGLSPDLRNDFDFILDDFLDFLVFA